MGDDPGKGVYALPDSHRRGAVMARMHTFPISHQALDTCPASEADL